MSEGWAIAWRIGWGGLALFCVIMICVYVRQIIEDRRARR